MVFRFWVFTIAQISVSKLGFFVLQTKSSLLGISRTKNIPYTQLSLLTDYFDDVIARHQLLDIDIWYIEREGEGKGMGEGERDREITTELKAMTP